jgi:hypothetical protein
MRKLLRASFAIALACLMASTALGTDALVKRRATLRSDPSTDRPPIATLQPQEDVELVEPSPTNGYYKVRTAEGDEGWVYSRNLEIVAASPSSAPPAPVPPAAPAGPILHAGIVSAVSPAWEKPEPNVTTFHGPDGVCGSTGDGGDTVTNKRKNRTDVPVQYHEVTWRAVQVLQYPAHAPKSLTDWNSQQLAEIEPYQGIAVSVVGYLAAIKPQDHGGGESTNCHFTNSEEVDWHIPLVERSGDPEATSIVVETTPRVRETHPKWTPNVLTPWVSSAAPVRISGWTMLDPEHAAHIGKFRSTLWEIHPITKIEVFKDGQWVDVDHLP